jgi:FkbM family methyltransferase
MTFFQNKLNGIHRRYKSILFGLFYWKNKHYRIKELLKIDGKWIKLKTNDFNIIEFTAICINDCYHLKYLKRRLGSIETIVDVGANQGIFIIAARQFFPNARIDCYEPNSKLNEILTFNAKLLNATPYFEAIMEHDCKVKLNFTGSDLATTSIEENDGNVIGISLSKVLKRIGSIDILKLDCEGAEWGILKDIENWRKIRSLTMEYHLWGSGGSKVEDIFELLNKMNFRLQKHKVYSCEQGIIIAINKSFK